MSSSVVKQALQLLQEDLQPAENASTSKKRKTNDAMKLISTNRRGVWKELRRLQKQEQQKAKSKSEKVSFKSTIEKYQEDQMVSVAKKTSYSDVSKVKPSKSARKVYEHHMKLFNRRKPKEDTGKKEESTVFTDRDFDKFEEEYDFFK